MRIELIVFFWQNHTHTHMHKSSTFQFQQKREEKKLEKMWHCFVQMHMLIDADAIVTILFLTRNEMIKQINNHDCDHLHQFLIDLNAVNSGVT